MYTDDEIDILSCYAELEREIEALLLTFWKDHICQKPGCRLARIALRRAEIKIGALQRMLSDLNVEAKANGNLI